MARKGQEVHALISGINHVPTERALRALTNSIESGVDRITILEPGGGGAVNSATGTAPISVTPTNGHVVISLNDDGVTDAKLRNSAGLSVIGRASNTLGDPGDIIAATDNDVLRRSGATLGFGSVKYFKVDGLTPGSVLFAGATGAIEQDNPHFFWDDTNDQLTVTTAAAAQAIRAISSHGTSGTMSIQNTNPSGPADFFAMDNGGTARLSWGYGNATYVDAARAGRSYVWRNGVNFVFARTGNVDTTLFSTGNWRMGSTVTDPGVKLQVDGSFTITGTAILGDNPTSDTHTINGSTTINGATSGHQLRVSSTGRTILGIIGDSDNAGSDAGYTGVVIGRGTGPTELWFVGRDGTTPSDGFIIRRAGTTNSLTINTSDAATFAGALSVPNATTTLRNLSVTGLDGTTAIDSQPVLSASTVHNEVARLSLSGTTNTTGGAVLHYGANIGCNVSRSAGANNVTNIALLLSSQNGQINRALQTEFGDVILNNSGGTTQIVGATTISNTLTVTGAAGSNSVTSSVTGSAETVSGRRALSGDTGGTWNTTAGALDSLGVVGIAAGSRSAGANNLTNYGGYFTALNGQINYALWTNAGTVVLNGSSGSTGIGTSTPAGKLAVATSDSGTDFAAGGFGADWVVIGPNASNATTAANLGLGYSTTSDEGQITTVNPSSGWKRLVFAGDSWSFRPASSSTNSVEISSAGAVTIKNTATVGDGVGSRNMTVNAGSGWADVRLWSANTNGGSLLWSDDSGSTYAGEIFYYHVADQFDFKTATTSRATLDATKLQVKVDLQVDGNTTLGNASTDTITAGGGVVWARGNGSPEGVVTAAVGSFYSRLDGGANTTWYVKESGAGNTGWIAK